MSSVKEYLQWRGVPRDLNIRIRRYYEYYYQRQAVFDENAILNGLSPSLHTELVQTICKDTLGRLPLFSKLSPEFQAKIFPMLKPLSVTSGEAIFLKGQTSKDLLFLLDGEVDVLSEHDSKTKVRRIRTTGETLLSHDEFSTELVTVDSVGCFGQTVLVGRRREAGR